MNAGTYAPGMDFEVRTMMDLFEKGKWADVTSAECTLFRARIADRLAMVEAGARRTPSWWNARLQEIDPYLRIRWCFEKICWVVERWVHQHRAWTTLKYWMDDSGAVPMDIFWLCHILRKNDLQRKNPWEHLAENRAKAAAIRKTNEDKVTSAVLAAVDSMSTKQVENFVRVEKALHTGEKITAHGSDLSFLERQAAATAVTPDIPRGKSLNPGMHPFLYKRDYANVKYEELK